MLTTVPKVVKKWVKFRAILYSGTDNIMHKFTWCDGQWVIFIPKFGRYPLKHIWWFLFYMMMPTSRSSFTLLSSSIVIRFSCFLKYFLLAAWRLNHVYAKDLTWGKEASMKGWNSSWNNNHVNNQLSIPKKTSKYLAYLSWPSRWEQNEGVKTSELRSLSNWTEVRGTRHWNVENMQPVTVAAEYHVSCNED